MQPESSSIDLGSDRIDENPMAQAVLDEILGSYRPNKSEPKPREITAISSGAWGGVEIRGVSTQESPLNDNLLGEGDFPDLSGDTEGEPGAPNVVIDPSEDETPRDGWSAGEEQEEEASQEYQRPIGINAAE